jgi:transcriptional antiterminator NusG
MPYRVKRVAKTKGLVVVTPATMDDDEATVVNGPPIGTPDAYLEGIMGRPPKVVTRFRCAECNHEHPQNELWEDRVGVHSEWKCADCSMAWYAVAVEPKKDNRVAKELAKQTKIHDLTKYVDRILSPSYKVKATKDTRKGTQTFMRTEQVTQGYVIVHAFLHPDLIHLVKGLKFVWGFLPLGADPVPITEAEAQRLLDTLAAKKDAPAEERKPVTLPYKLDDVVTVTSGAMKGSGGPVTKVEGDPCSPLVTAAVKAFGTTVPVTLPWTFFTKNQKEIRKTVNEVKAGFDKA